LLASRLLYFFFFFLLSFSSTGLFCILPDLFNYLLFFLFVPICVSSFNLILAFINRVFGLLIIVILEKKTDCMNQNGLANEIFSEWQAKYENRPKKIEIFILLYIDTKLRTIIILLGWLIHFR
jgi:hypothetical protein